MLQKLTFQEKEHSFALGNQILTFTSGKYAQKADGAVTLTLGENVMLATSVMDVEADESKDFLPLMVDWREAFSAIWRIAGSSYRRREWRPSDTTILYSRMTDRSIRPLFPKAMINSTVVSLTPLALDNTEDLWVLSIVWASISLMISGIPFDGPVGAARVAYVEDTYVINPNKEQLAKATLNLLVAWPHGLINMIEMDANEVSEEILLEAFEIWQKEIDRLCEEQTTFTKMHNITVQIHTTKYPTDDLIQEIKKTITDQDLEQLMDADDFGGWMRALEKKADEALEREIYDHRYKDVSFGLVKQAVYHIIKYYIRSRTLDTGVRVDNRDIHTIRPLFAEVGSLPRVHGSGLFWRWDTQVLSTCTLWAPWDKQTVDDMENEQVAQTYMHHYNFPPFSTGEARWTRGAGRREIGHGKLAEKAIEYMIPDLADFPYTIRLVSDCLGSGWSTSMASTCASTLALMDAWVPLKKPVAGIAMWLMTRHSDTWDIADYAVLTDLKWTEDFIGDMDFKVTWTKDGMTAIQLDVKIKGLTMEIVRETVSRADKARKEILVFMSEILAAPRATVSTYAPKIETFSVNPDKIKLVIGKGGETIDKIIELAWWVKIDFQDDGTVFISDVDADKIAKAKEMILDIAEDLPLNQTLEGSVASVQAYGLFVNLPRKKSWLVHVSKLGPLVWSIDASYKEWQAIKVKITEVDKQGRLVLDMVK